MKLAVLFSGGKDSTYALWKAMVSDEVSCLVTIESSNPESYMFHTPNIGVATLQAQAVGIPFVKKSTEGGKETELADLEAALAEAKRRYGVEGVVTGAIESVYQAERIQRICDRLGLWCFNPLWKMDQERLLRELIAGGFKVIVSGVFAYPLDESWLGRRLDGSAVAELLALRDKYKISPSGEGGEIETTVVDAPFFRMKVEVSAAERVYKGGSGVFIMQSARLVGK